MTEHFAERVRMIAEEDSFAFQEMLDRWVPRLHRLLALHEGWTHLSGETGFVREELLNTLHSSEDAWSDEPELLWLVMRRCLPRLEGRETRTTKVSVGKERNRSGNTGGSLGKEPVVEWKVTFARSAGFPRSSAKIEGAFLRLPSDDRVLLLLRHYLGFAYSRIAREIGVAEELEARWRHALASVRLQDLLIEANAES